MLPFKRILWPTDFSDASHAGLTAAIELATQFQSELLIVHVTAGIPRPSWALQFYSDPEVYELEIHDYEIALGNATRRKLNDLVDRMAPKELEIKQIVASGDAPTEIVRVADEEGVDLITITTHGLSGWRHLVHGSVTEKVLRLANCPVLTIRPPHDSKKEG